LNVISIFNILVYAIFFTQLAFAELKENVISGEGSNIAYYFHFITLAIVIYFAWLLYKTNKEQLIFEVFNKKAIVWIIAGAIVYITSSELILDGLKIGNPEITAEQLTD